MDYLVLSSPAFRGLCVPVPHREDRFVGSLCQAALQPLRPIFFVS